MNKIRDNLSTFPRSFHGDEMPEVVVPPGDTYPVLVKVKDYLTWGEEIEVPVDLVVLATGMIPTGVGDTQVEGGVELDEHGFLSIRQPNGHLAAGCAKRPADVATCTRDATGVALKALHLGVE